MTRIENKSDSVDRPNSFSRLKNSLIAGWRSVIDSWRGRDEKSHHQNLERRLAEAEDRLKYRLALADKAKLIERMNGELTEAFNTVAFLYSVTQGLNAASERGELITAVQKAFTEAFRCDQFLLILSDNDHVPMIAASRNVPDLPGPTSWQDGFAELIAKDKKPLTCRSGDPGRNAKLSPIERSLDGYLFVAPFLVRGSIAGILAVARSEENFTASERRTIEIVTGQIAATYDRCTLYTRTKELSVRDELTGLYNRRHFQALLDAEVKRCERHNRTLSLLMIDVDHFKSYNDTFGHVRGDVLLKNIASILHDNLRSADVIARFGGEEFIVLLTETTREDALAVAEKLRDAMRRAPSPWRSQPMTSGSEPIKPATVSIGVAGFPDHGRRPVELIDAADAALYKAKRTGRDRVCIFDDSEIPQEAPSRLGLVH